MRKAILATALLAGFSFPVWAQNAGVDPGTASRCESCHGEHASGATPSTPRLNGQLAPYIVNRLIELTDATQNSVQATMAMHDLARMSDALRAAIADYFSRQAPTASQPEAGKLAAMGGSLYSNGDASHQLPPCQSCHGARGEGQGAAPRLAGQRREYLKNQLWNFNFVMRESPTMHPVGLRLEADQIDALVAWLGAD